ncbi:MAG: T9SS C-terminal target domain-containing protein [Calditrichaeota bacterium]|nr:MAG: T9SS C-terminal target domain-containing protein [Calditrichota bacterium]
MYINLTAFREGNNVKQLTIIVFSIICISIPISSKDLSSKRIKEKSATIDNTTYINANKILMFLTNHGNFGRDISAVFGYDYGTFYPFNSYYDLENGFNTSSVLYAAGIWVGGKVNDSIRVAISEYSSEFVPGPIINGTIDPDNPEYKVYKLYYDSLVNNPNSDYLSWPDSLGAPVDDQGNPKLRGHQMLWTVFNDADTAQHTNMNTLPLGLEIQQTVWSQYEPGSDSTYIPETFRINPINPNEENNRVQADIIEYNQLTQNDYMVIINYNDTAGNYWTLINTTTGDTLADNQYTDTSEVIDGFQLIINRLRDRTFLFQATANGAGVLDPPEAAAAVWYDYPVPREVDPDGYITEEQQVGDGSWLIATGDNGGTSGGGINGPYVRWLERTLPLDYGFQSDFVPYNLQLRFTGSTDNPGVNGSYAWDPYHANISMWVPFELWRVNRTDTTEQLRLIPWIYDDGNQIFDLSYFGSFADGTCGPGGCEHSISGSDNDPYTDWIYFLIPSDEFGNDAVSGDSAYNVFEQAMINDPLNWVGYEKYYLRRIVLVNWNGGISPPFNQALPEIGSVFEITTNFDYKSDTLLFSTPSEYTVEFSSENSSIYMAYKLYNKGGNYIDSCYVGIWSDPDLGNAGNDLVGCDTTNNIMFCYNGSDYDTHFPATAPPAFGMKILAGPHVSSPGDSALFADAYIYDAQNLPMSSFTLYIGGTDPDDSIQTLNYLKGLTRFGDAYVYNNNELSYFASGDPFSGQGDLDKFPADRRMMGAMGPFNFAPGDSQYVLIKLSVGLGGDRLNSLEVLKEILNTPEKVISDPNPWPEPEILPTNYILHQNYPNPFNPSTTIKFTTAASGKVNITVYNILGQKVKTLLDKFLPASNDHSVTWDGTGNKGKKVASGIYLYQLKAEDNEISKKMIFLK